MSEKHEHFYDCLCSREENAIIVALAYSEYKKTKIIKINELRSLGKSEAVIDRKMKEWQKDECIKAHLYVTNAEKTYKESIDLLLKGPLHQIENRITRFQEEVNTFCPKKKTFSSRFWGAVTASVVAWVVCILLSYILFISFSNKGLLGTIGQHLVEYSTK